MAYSLDYSIEIDKISNKEKTEKLVATDKECKELAERFKIIGISDVVAEITYKKKADIIYVRGNISCTVKQECVVSLDLVENDIKEEFELLFSLNDEELADEILLSEDMPELMDSNILNLGEIVAEQISLAIPDFPKKAGVEFKDHIETNTCETCEDKPTHRPFANLLQSMKVDNSKDNGGN